MQKVHVHNYYSFNEYNVQIPLNGEHLATFNNECFTIMSRLLTTPLS